MQYHAALADRVGDSSTRGRVSPILVDPYTTCQVVRADSTRASSERHHADCCVGNRQVEKYVMLCRDIGIVLCAVLSALFRRSVYD